MRNASLGQERNALKCQGSSAAAVEVVVALEVALEEDSAVALEVDLAEEPEAAV